MSNNTRDQERTRTMTEVDWCDIVPKNEPMYKKTAMATTTTNTVNESRLRQYRERLAKLFPDVDPEVRHLLRLDSVALYSVTDQRTADAFSRVLLRYVSAKSTVTNATACAGGNTLSFSTHFAHVHAIERDRARHEHLLHNMEVLGVKNVTTQWADALDVLLPPPCSVSTPSEASPLDVVFIDPPWGGPSYGQHKCLSLFLSGIELSVLLRKMAQGRRARVVSLKVPLNFDFSTFALNCGLDESSRDARSRKHDCEDEGEDDDGNNGSVSSCYTTSCPDYRVSSYRAAVMQAPFLSPSSIRLLHVERFGKMCFMVLRLDST